jgi:hypothetical protein
MSLLGFLSLLSVLSAPPRNRAPAKQAKQGQGMMEYALMLLLVALVVISGVTLLMPVIQRSLAAMMPGL